MCSCAQVYVCVYYPPLVRTFIREAAGGLINLYAPTRIRVPERNTKRWNYKPKKEAYAYVCMTQVEKRLQDIKQQNKLQKSQTGGGVPSRQKSASPTRHVNDNGSCNSTPKSARKEADGVGTPQNSASKNSAPQNRSASPSQRRFGLQGEVVSVCLCAFFMCCLCIGVCDVCASVACVSAH